MQLEVQNQTYASIIASAELIFPTCIVRVAGYFKALKKGVSAVSELLTLIIKILYRAYFPDGSKPSDLYTNVWNQTNCDADLKDNVGPIQPFKINIPDKILSDLKLRLERTRIEDSLVNPDQEFNSDCLRKLTDYWKNQYQWKKHEAELNKYPQFITNIKGLDVHFIHTKHNQGKGNKLKVVPLLLIHSWPGTFMEFYKVIPFLTTPCIEQGFVFEVVCPSVPGSGFSEAPRSKGFNAKATARIMLSLMDRLGYSKFYVHGYEWGSITASLMARYYPFRVQGLHVNMCFSVPNLLDSFIKSVVIALCPFLIDSAEYQIFFPFKNKLRKLFEDSGYLHFNSTKPDTLGCAMADSPVSMAAYILDKILPETNPDYLDLHDGYLTQSLSFDEVLTMVTIQWVNNNFVSGARFFKENMNDVLKRTHEKLPLAVPCGVAFFPNQVIMLPKFMMADLVDDLVSYTVMPRSAHLAALEEPQLLADDIHKFVHIVETRPAKLPITQEKN
ncbi:epoxide hydrolase 1 [Nephila pilipes]|uniref:microsomal epoxide hydrolase n=1 Tax=Nephila pilipes TaxID=299642 RepID=A0A8X6QKM0_NEPPI|nr:epoxide hydrolase 1 [Nephila pilipes]